MLVRWAAAAIETSSNQPVLPHAIIALNASEHDIDTKLWNVRFNTETILQDLAHTVNRNETFKKWAQFWRERGKAIDSLLDLVLCYYSTIQVSLPPGVHYHGMQSSLPQDYSAASRWPPQADGRASREALQGDFHRLRCCSWGT